MQGFRSLQEGLIFNEKYSLDSNIIQQWIIILVNRNKCLRDYLHKDRQVCNFLMKAATKKTPSDEIARKNVPLALLRGPMETSWSTSCMGSSFPGIKRAIRSWARIWPLSTRISWRTGLSKAASGHQSLRLRLRTSRRATKSPICTFFLTQRYQG